MLPEVFIRFHTADQALQAVFDAAEEKCRRNLRFFGPYQVLVEGGGYEKIWLETQPMGGEMYALRSLEAAKNNAALFMRCQRPDGRLPGSIRWAEGKLIPEFNKLQGFCLPDHALNLYYLLGRDEAFLRETEDALRLFDRYLHAARDVNGDGTLSSFCVYDTGEDGAARYGDAPCWWEEEAPPEGFQVVPMASMDVTSWSYACRSALAEICRIRGDEEKAAGWQAKAKKTAQALTNRLWDEARGAFFDRDKNGDRVDVLGHHTLRCMYFGSASAQQAGRFVREHLLSPNEFWTALPLPSVSVSDPAFCNAPENNWSGQPQGLTFQRTIVALENYGYHKIVTALGEKLIGAVQAGGCRFTQQFDPFSGRPSLVHAVTHQPVSPGGSEPVQDAYGPTLLSVLTFIAHRYGIHPRLGKVWWSLGGGKPCEWEAAFYGHRYTLKSDGRRAELAVDGKALRAHPCGVRLITDERGELLSKVDIE